MCLSTVYKNKMEPESIAMKNVMGLVCDPVAGLVEVPCVKCKDGCVILTDLMERTCVIEGELERANLVDGYVIVRENIPA